MTSGTNVNCIRNRLTVTSASVDLSQLPLMQEDRKHIQSDFDPTSSCTAEKGFRLAK